MLTMRTRKTTYFPAFLVAMLLAVPAGLTGQQPSQTDKNVVWQIGVFDQSSQEFGGGFDWGSKSFKPVFTVGQSKTQDWPARQTTSASGNGSPHPTPYT